MAEEYWAHTGSDERGGEWQLLKDHLVGTAARAREFGGEIGLSHLCEALGLLHDAGKYSREFQCYLAEAAALAEREGRAARPGRTVDHKLLGAQVATESLPEGVGAVIGLLVAGHHGGLPDRCEFQSLARRSAAEAMRRALEDKAFDSLPLPDSVIAEMTRETRDPLAADLMLRMAFSCLVDADALDTEQHFEPSRASLRGARFDLVALLARLRESQAARMAGCEPTEVNALRAEVYSACLAAAEEVPGCFRLTVPTGGGKTLSSLAFALTHAVSNGLNRVIYAIPYTSIVDQTVDVFRQALGDERAVLAHHSSAFEPIGGEEEAGPDWRRLAADNWDAPVVVTTNVQFFESLLGSRPGRCRKVHRIAGSVVVLDEVQTLSPRLLDPLLDVIKRLAADWGTTFVLCSATQPALEDVDKPGIALSGIREIVPDYQKHFRLLRRVEYEAPEASWSWERLAEEMMRDEQCLAILNTRRDALSVLEALGDMDVLHLSTFLTPTHRRDVLREIRQRLAEGASCRVVSTQVVEAGVDIDFPVVMRALGPLDRLIQAAGRCNREGRFDFGRMIAFEPEEGGLPRAEYRTGTELARMAVRRGAAALHDPATSTAYFRELYANVELDAEYIQSSRAALGFRTVDRDFHMIEEDSVAVVIMNDATRNLIHEAERAGIISRASWAVFQQHSVSVQAREIPRFTREALVRPLDVRASVYVWQGEYDQVRGLGDMKLESGALIA
jgi:CRISPR-associated endonuclease/helicase Cas3